MGGLIPIVSLFIVLMFGLLITRIASVALMFTGLSRELARFQARSAFVGVGFTTSESEHVLAHPVRRRIIMWLMLLGNAGYVAAISSLIPIFIGTGDEANTGLFYTRLLLIASGIALLWGISVSKWVDRQMSRAIEWALKRWTRLDVRDYPALLQLSAGYTVGEVEVEENSWVAGKSLIELRLADEGVQVLGIRRTSKEYIGAPRGNTYIRKGDNLIVYGLVAHIAELDHRRAGDTGDKAHDQRVREHHRATGDELDGDRTINRSGAAPTDAGR